MTHEEYLDYLDSLENNASMLYQQKVRAAYEKNKALFVTYVDCSTLTGAARTCWEALIKEELLQEYGGNPRVLARQVWRAVLSVAKWLSESASNDYKNYCLTLMENRIGTKKECLRLMHARDKMQFSTMVHGCGLSIRIVRLVQGNYYQVESSTDGRDLEQAYDALYELCKADKHKVV